MILAVVSLRADGSPVAPGADAVLLKDELKKLDEAMQRWSTKTLNQ